jgi:lipopolysaccharide biosynthesis regulator YciM
MNLILLGAVCSLSAMMGLVIGLKWPKRKNTISSDESKIAFLKGFRYLLSNETDRAIEAFTKAVRLDTETIETYVALGNLLRDKGEFERAIRIRQNIMTRPHLDKQIRLQALYDLAIDYKKGGFVDRAVESFKEIIRQDPKRADAYLELASLYQEIKDWEAAYKYIEQLANFTKNSYSLMLAHFKTEMGKVSQKEDLGMAEKLYREAIKIDKRCVDAYLHLGDLYLMEENTKKALSVWLEVIKNASDYAFLVYRRIEEHLDKLQADKALEKLIEYLKKMESHDVSSCLILARYYHRKNRLDLAKNYLEEALRQAPQHSSARQFLAQILLEEGKMEAALAEIKSLVKIAILEKSFQCSQCGYKAHKLSWKCPQCGNWDTIKPKTN